MKNLIAYQLFAVVNDVVKILKFHSIARNRFMPN